VRCPTRGVRLLFARARTRPQDDASPSIDPEGATARRQAALAAAQPAAPAEVAPAAATPADGPAADASPAPPQTPIEKATTEAAKPEEIPSGPDDLGLSIEDTNPL